MTLQGYNFKKCALVVTCRTNYYETMEVDKVFEFCYSHYLFYEKRELYKTDVSVIFNDLYT